MDNLSLPSSSIPPPVPPSPSNLLMPNFPDDISLQILARIPRTHFSNISLVSKSWLSLVKSPLYFTIRSQLNSTQLFLYINLRIHCSNSRWLVLECNPQSQTPTKISSVPPTPEPAIGSAYAALGSKIYVIGGAVNEVPSAHVWVFDARFNAWEKGANMKVGREFAAAGVISGKIYALGGCSVDNRTRSNNWAEVYDPSIGSWEGVPSPVEIREKWMHGSAVIDNKMYAMADRGGVLYDPRELSWGCVSTEMDLGWRGRAAVVDNVLFCYDYLGKIKGFDAKEFMWRELKGLKNELPKFLCGATMANAGGRLCVVWEGQGTGRQIKVSCAEIEVRRDCFGELWGSIVWSQAIQEIPGGSAVVHCLAVEI